MCIFESKNKSLVHIRLLQQALKHGLVVKKVRKATLQETSLFKGTH